MLTWQQIGPIQAILSVYLPVFNITSKLLKPRIIMQKKKTYKCAAILELLSELLAGLNEAVEATELTLGLRVWLNKFIMGLEELAGELGLSVGLF